MDPAALDAVACGEFSLTLFLHFSSQEESLLRLLLATTWAETTNGAGDAGEAAVVDMFSKDLARPEMRRLWPER